MTTPFFEQDNNKEMVQCQVCGHNIPATNFEIHSGRCHGCRFVESFNEEDEEEEMNEDDDDTTSGGGHEEEEEYWSCSMCTLFNPMSSDICEACYTSRPRRVTESEIENENDLPEATTRRNTSIYPGHRSPVIPSSNQEEWSCPRCTLINPRSSYICEACAYHNNNSSSLLNPQQTQQPQPLQVEVREFDPRVAQAVTSTASIASWSLLGALVGGPIGALVTGGSAAFIDGIQRHQRRRREASTDRRQEPRIHFANADGSNTLMMSITDNNTGRNGEGPPRTRIIMVRPAPGGGGGGGTNDFFRHMDEVDPQFFLEMLLRQVLAANTQDLADIHLPRGASQESIDKLPLQTLTEDNITKELNDNQKTCNICLEEFKPNQVMRTLPKCNHVFHQQCIDRWLTQVASCPICKKEILENEEEEEEGNDDGEGNTTSSSNTTEPPPAETTMASSSSTSSSSPNR